jgi:hypothetical protein
MKTASFARDWGRRGCCETSVLSSSSFHNQQTQRTRLRTSLRALLKCHIWTPPACKG